MFKEVIILSETFIFSSSSTIKFFSPTRTGIKRPSLCKAITADRVCSSVAAATTTRLGVLSVLESCFLMHQMILKS